MTLPFVDHQHENAVERVLSEVLGNSVVEEPVKDEKQQQLHQKHNGQLVEEEVEVVGVEAQSVGVSREGEVVIIVFLLVQSFHRF